MCLVSFGQQFGERCTVSGPAVPLNVDYCALCPDDSKIKSVGLLGISVCNWQMCVHGYPEHTSCGATAGLSLSWRANTPLTP